MKADFSDSGSEVSSNDNTSTGNSEEKQDHEAGSTMMSIFASYYGIENDTSKNKLSIDSPQFEAEEYIEVQVILFSIFLLNFTRNTIIYFIGFTIS
jgi:hypothetical protein